VFIMICTSHNEKANLLGFVLSSPPRGDEPTARCSIIADVSRIFGGFRDVPKLLTRVGSLRTCSLPHHRSESPRRRLHPRAAISQARSGARLQHEVL
jgi:hypothetical protein